MIISSTKNYKPAPEGITNAVCVDVEDCGVTETQWGPRHQVKFIWEIPALKENGKRFTVSRRYTASTHEKSALRKDLKSWRGRDLAPEELKGFEINSMIEQPCQLVLVHEQGKDGRTYARVENVLKPNGNVLTPSGEYARKAYQPQEGSWEEQVAA